MKSPLRRKRGTMVTRPMLDRLSRRIEMLAQHVEDGRGIARITLWVHEDDAAAMQKWFSGEQGPAGPNPDFRIESEAEAVAAHMAAHPEDVGKRIEFGIVCRWLTRAEAQTRGWA